MQIEINLLARVPIYVQIISQIKHKIATGDLKPGDQLPTVRQLAADLRVNFNTIARAYRMLDEEGIISTQQGRGTYILELSSIENGANLRQEDLDNLTNYYLAETYRLGFDPEDVLEIFQKSLKAWQDTGMPLFFDQDNK